MNLSKNKVLFLFVISAVILLLNTSCSRKVQDSSIIQLTLPSGMGSSKISEFKYSEPMSMQSVSAQSDGEGAEWNPTLNPAALADVNCYMITVSGPEADMGRNTCTTTTGPNLKIGRWVGGIPAGSILSLEVPSGPQREITVIGFKASAGACTNFKNSDVSGMSLSEPHILGKIVKDLTPGSQAVSISIAVNANTLKIDDCAGPDFNFENAPLYFGDALPGVDATIASPQNYTALTGHSGRMIAFNTSPIAPNANYTFIETVNDGGFAVGDEVMIAVQGLSGSWTGSGNNAVGPCGYRAWEGSYSFARVMQTSGAPYGVFINEGTFIDKLDYDITGTQSATVHTNVTTNLSTSAIAGSEFCRIKLAKVLHFHNLTISSGGSITAPLFNFDTDTTGIIPIRVSNNLNLANNPGSAISAAYMGYGPLQFYHGSGLRGVTSMACSAAATDTRTGGSCGVGSNGGSGGGHGNLNASNPFDLSGGAGGGSSPGFGGMGAGENCGDGSCFGTLSHKIFMGGAGGGGTQTGLAGAGGGIIYLMAKNVIVAPSANVNFNAKGNIGGNAVSPGAGAHGGGAGGSIVFGFQNMTLPNTSFLQIYASGGDGGDASGTGGSGGGAGGGGRIHLTHCQSATFPVANLTTYVNSGNGGNSSSGSVGMAGSVGTAVTSSVPCN